MLEPLIDTLPGEFKRAYPTAKVIAPEDAIKRHEDKDLKFDGSE